MENERGCRCIAPFNLNYPGLYIIVVCILAATTAFAGVAAAENVESPDCTEVELQGEGVEDAPYVVVDVVQLQCVGHEASETELDNFYVLDGDVDAGVTADWNDGGGFEPLGDDPGEPGEVGFSGVFDGSGGTITGLHIERPDEGFVGLFSGVDDGGEVVDLHLEEVDVTGETEVGGVAGVVGSPGSVCSVSVSGSIEGLGSAVGGISGGNQGVICDADVDATVMGESNVGGVSGGNQGVIEASTAAVEVTGYEGGVGGLAGTNRGTVTGSFVEGDVQGEDNVGGAFGLNDGDVQTTGFEGNVSGENLVGGLVGLNDGGAVEKSYSDGWVSAEDTGVGGLLGLNNGGEVVSSYSIAQVDGTQGIGGLVGGNSGFVSTSFAAGAVAGEQSVGGLVGQADDASDTKESYWDVETTGQLDGVGAGDEQGAVGLSTAEMTDQSAEDNLLGLDFKTTWTAVEGTYPRLNWQEMGHIFPCPDGLMLDSCEVFFDDAGEPVDDGEVITILLTWNSTGEVGGVEADDGEIITLLLNWQGAR